MSLFNFRVRGAERDRRTDGVRFGRLGEDIGRLCREVEREKAGLKTRYDASVGDAAFAQQALEDGKADARLFARVEELTRAVIDYDRRMHALDGQIALLQEMAGMLDAAFPRGATTHGARASGRTLPATPTA